MRARGVRLAAALLAAAVGACGQAMVEYALGVGKAAAAAPAMKKAGEASAEAFKKLGQTLEKGGQAQAARGLPGGVEYLPATRRLGPFLDPATLAAGLTLSELLNRYGDPFMKTAGGLGTDAGDTWWYRGAGGSILAEVREGKVAVVTTEAERKKQAASGIVIVQ